MDAKAGKQIAAKRRNKRKKEEKENLTQSRKDAKLRQTADEHRFTQRGVGGGER
jgi:hypothetical protein